MRVWAGKRRLLLAPERCRTFASGKLGSSWGLSQLEATQAIAGQAPVDHLVVERLALLAPEHPSETVRCLALMVDGAEEDWHIHHWATDVETILKAALHQFDLSAVWDQTFTNLDESGPC